jgi:hypothetical protein
MLLGFYFAARKHFVLKDAKQVEGRVIGHVSESIGRSKSYKLKVEYFDSTGHRHEFITTQATGPAAKAIGESVLAFIPENGENPDVLVFELLYLKYFIGITLGGFALVCLLSPYLLRAIYTK